MQSNLLCSHVLFPIKNGHVLTHLFLDGQNEIHHGKQCLGICYMGSPTKSLATNEDICLGVYA